MKRNTRTRNVDDINRTVRTTGRIKKAKVVFDPSDNYLPRNKLPSSSLTSSYQSTDNQNERKHLQNFGTMASDHQENACYICFRKESKKLKAKMLSCKDCHRKVHNSCLQFDFENFQKLQMNFRCEDCLTCSSCFEGVEDGYIITCTKCVNSYHFSCHIPNLLRLPNDTKWLCSKCTIPNTLSNMSEEYSNGIGYCGDEVAGRFIEPKNNNLLRCNSYELCDIPNVRNWTTNEVVNYFKVYFPQEATIFKEQDIDGQSLLLLKRSDVVDRFAVKLGPALRIYNLILKLQMKSTDPTIGW